MAGETNKSGVTVDSLLDYFMSLYKVHLGVPRDASSEIVPVEPSKQNPRLITYDLFVEHNEKRLSRRVTLGPIAEDTGSKSSCFLAIYDSKLVIKIPPKPVTDFAEYIRCIERDRKIVAALSPRECLIPGVSMILDKIYKFPRTNELKGNRREDIYFEWLHYNQEYQRYLKIEGSFAFFMDLSRHMFLSDVLSLFHGLEAKIQEEMIKDPGILDNFEKFEGRYGIDNTPIGVDLKDVYSGYDDKARRLMMQTSVASSALLYKTQYWFFSYISGRPLKEDEADLTEDRVTQFNRLLAQTVEENRAVIDEYRAMIAGFLRNKQSSQNRHYKEGLVAGIIDMLAWLKDKGVAVRDIKPDNLLLAGDPDNYPIFLATPERFSIGLIDFETAVIFQTKNQEQIEQPLLGGTSLYATPLHMFNNNMLAGIYKDLPRALYLQDWYSVTAMIYRIITGDYLFVATARLFPVVAGKLREAKQEKRPAETVVREVSSVFWKSAVKEFEAGLEKYGSELQSLRAVTCESARRMFIEDLAAENRCTDQRIKELINRQVLFKSQKNREQLYAAPPEQVAQFIKRAKESPGAEAQSLAMLAQIRSLKVELQNNRETGGRLEAGRADFSVYELLSFMFTRVARFMNMGRLPS